MKEQKQKEVEEAVSWFCKELEGRETYLDLEELAAVLTEKGFEVDIYPPVIHWDPVEGVRTTTVIVSVAKGEAVSEFEARFVRVLSEMPPLMYWEVLRPEEEE